LSSIQGTKTCLRCGERFAYYFGFQTFKPHSCATPPKVKIYTEEEKKEFERKRKAGEI